MATMYFTAELDGSVATLGAVADAYESIRSTYGLSETSNPVIPLYNGVSIQRIRVSFRKDSVDTDNLQTIHDVWESIVASYSGLNMVPTETVINY